ncbi:ABC transporter permease [Gryllotalpicola reticulitermitis]|uniref:ABC transporter permease n=1 Tax=Gryllotalpicola reticulitermitis TaxID=1184153 RepID=A0ABV8Q7M5_9MICO
MTAISTPPTEVSAGSVRAAAELTRSRKTPIILTIFAVLGVVLFVLLGRGGTTTLDFTGQGVHTLTIPHAQLPARGTGYVIAAIAVLMAAGAWVLGRGTRRVPTWYGGVFAIVLLVGFLVWAAAGHTLPVIGLLTGSLALSAPIIFGALGGVVSERVGVVNIAIEAQLLAGAFVSAIIATITHNLYAGVVGAMAASVLVSFVLGSFAVRYAVDQVIVGIVLNVLVLGLTTFLYQTVLVNNATAVNSPGTFHQLPIPGLAEIPVLGPILFDQTIIIYLMYIAVIAVFIGMFKTRWGLRLRAVGEHPQAADTVGINVPRTRFWNVALAGAIVGVGGAYFTLGSVGPFSQDVTSGLGYIALAAVIFGKWDPVRATFAALLFGFANNLQNVLGIIGSPVPSDFMLMLPYVVTIFAVAGLVGRVRGPAASGKPYLGGH